MIAANRRSSFADPGHKLEVSNLTFADNDEFMLLHLDGGTLTDIELQLHSA